MKKSIEMEVAKKVKITVEIDFPLYRKDKVVSMPGMNRISYERITANGEQLIINVNHFQSSQQRSYEIELSKNVKIARDDDKTLGKGYFVCTAAEFNDALKEANQFIQQQLEVTE